jgi:excisionase family DNA binding protein
MWQVGTAQNNFSFIYYILRKDKTMKDTYMTVGEIAEMLKISYDKALDFVKYSGVEYVLIGRQYRVLDSKLNAFLYPPKKVKQPLRRRPIYQIIERK